MSCVRVAKQSRRDEGEASANGLHTESSRRTGDSSRRDPKGMGKLLHPSYEALDTDEEEVDPSFDLDESIKSDPDHIMRCLGRMEF